MLYKPKEPFKQEKVKQGDTIDFNSYAKSVQEIPERQLIYNSVTCLDCGETLVSNYTHDYKTCNCSQQTMVDGGLSYAKFGGKDLNRVQKNHLYSDSPHEKVRQVIARGSRGKSGKESLSYILLKDIDDDYLKAIIEYEQKNRPDNPLIKIYKNEQEFRKNN